MSLQGGVCGLIHGRQGSQFAFGNAVGSPDGEGGGGSEGGKSSDSAVFETAGEEIGIGVGGDAAEMEPLQVGVDVAEFVVRAASGQGHPGTCSVDADEFDLGDVIAGGHAIEEEANVAYSLGKPRAVEAECVAGEIFDHGGSGLAIDEEFAGLKEVGSKNSATGFQDVFSGGDQLAFLVEELSFAFAIDPEDGGAVEVVRDEGNRGDLLLGGRALQIDFNESDVSFDHFVGDFTRGNFSGFGCFAEHDAGGGADELFVIVHLRRRTRNEPGVLIRPGFREGIAQSRRIDAIGGQGVRVIVNGKFLRGDGDKFAFEDRLGEAEVQVPVEPGVHHFAGDLVVVVSELREAFGVDFIGSVVETVDGFEFREAFGFDIDGPVVGSAHGLGSGGEEGGEGDVIDILTEVGTVFTDTAALHIGGDHDGGEGDVGTFVDGAEHEGLRSAAAGTGDADAIGIDIGEREEEIESAAGIESLEAHEILESEFGFDILEAGGVSDLSAVGVTDHVIMEDDAAHAGEADHAGLQRILRSAFKFLGAGSDLLSSFVCFGFVEATVQPVPMGAEDAGGFSLQVLRAIEIARDIVAGMAGEKDLLDGVVVFFDLAVDDRLEGSGLGHGPEAVADQDLFAKSLRRFFPGFEGGRRRPGVEFIAGVAGSGFEASIDGRLLAGGIDARGIVLRLKRR